MDKLSPSLFGANNPLEEWTAGRAKCPSHMCRAEAREPLVGGRGGTQAPVAKRGGRPQQGEEVIRRRHAADFDE